MNFFSLFFYVYFLLTAVVGACLAAIVCLSGSDPLRSRLHALICRWAYHYIQLNPRWRIVWSGREHLSLPGPYIIVANHQSVIDPFVLSGLNIDFKWVAKRWVFDCPIVGSILARARYVCLDPKTPTKALETCAFWLRQGISVFIFPEGTRSADGELQEFHSGAFRLSTMLGVPILPVAINGTRDILPKHSRTLSSSATLEVRILPPVCTSSPGSNHNTLRARVRQLIQDELTSIRGGTTCKGERLSKCKEGNRKWTSRESRQPGKSLEPEDAGQSSV